MVDERHRDRFCSSSCVRDSGEPGGGRNCVINQIANECQRGKRRNRMKKGNFNSRGLFEQGKSNGNCLETLRGSWWTKRAWRSLLTPKFVSFFAKELKILLKTNFQGCGTTFLTRGLHSGPKFAFAAPKNRPKLSYDWLFGKIEIPPNAIQLVDSKTVFPTRTKCSTKCRPQN